MSFQSRDVVVIGGGPSGSSTAFHLARSGYDVLVVEKDAFPREKVCGDGLTPRSRQKLEEMGIRSIPGMLEIHGIRIFENMERSERTHWFEAEGPDPGYGGVVPRHTLDQLLVEAAAEAGADFWMRSTATQLDVDRRGRAVGLRVRKGEREVLVRARFFVVSEGSVGRFGHLLRRSANHRTSLQFAARQYFRGTFDVEPFFDVHLPVYDGGRVVPGYGWVFPVSEDLLNVGAGFTYGVGYPEKIRIRALYDRFLQTLRRRDPRMCGPIEACGPLVGASLRIGLDPSEAVAPGLLATGDAASLVNPFNGEGISYALESGELAALAIDEALEQGAETASTYPALLRERYRRHALLRDELPRLFGITRLYPWHPPNLASSHSSGGVLAPCIRHLVSDHDKANPSALHETLWKDLLSTEQRSDHRLVEDRVLGALMGYSPALGEIAYYTRSGLLGVPGGLTALVLLVGSARDGAGLSDLEVELCVASELTMTANLYLCDVSESDSDADENEPRPMSALAILIADMTISTIYALLNSLDETVASPMSRAIRDYSATLLEDRIRGRLCGPDPSVIGETNERSAAFTGDVIRLVAQERRFSARACETLAAFSESLWKALTQVADLWIDLRGHEINRGSAPLYLMRRGHYGEHVAEARRRGLDLSLLPELRAGQLDDWKVDRFLLELVASGAVAQVLDVARANLHTAERALDLLPEGFDATRLRRLAANVRLAAQLAEAWEPLPAQRPAVSALRSHDFAATGVEPAE